MARTELLDHAEALRDGPFYLSVPGDRGRRTGGVGGPEWALEKKLLISENFKEHFGLQDGKLARQIPVGLFRESVKRAKRIFTAGAVDMIGIAGGVLKLFELKAGSNIPAGIISELLFYTSVMRDAIGQNARSIFNTRQTAGGTTVQPNDIVGCARIEAVLLGEKFHPLIGHADVISCLNAAAARNWNVSRDSIPVKFRGVTLEHSEAGCLFIDL